MAQSKRRRNIIYTSFAAITAALAAWTAWNNSAVELSRHAIVSGDIAPGLDGFRIAHVSDLHNTVFDDGNAALLALLGGSRPDIIAITGDIVDCHRTDTAAALEFAARAMEIAPCFYVPGNHESRISDYAAFRDELSALGVTVLEDERMVLSTEGGSIAVAGLMDPTFHTRPGSQSEAKLIDARLGSLAAQDGLYTLLLSHRPELFEVYVRHGIHLVLAGHAHGGQFRLPFIGGLAAPNQGIFPKYDAGRFTKGGTDMIVSRGIGNSTFPFRFNNRPEILLIELAAGSRP